MAAVHQTYCGGHCLAVWAVVAAVVADLAAAVDLVEEVALAVLVAAVSVVAEPAVGGRGKFRKTESPKVGKTEDGVEQCL